MAEEIKYMPRVIFSPGEKIVAMTEVRGNLYITTETRVWKKEPHSDVFKPVLFEDIQPNG